jgi:hypothetical protein
MSLYESFQAKRKAVNSPTPTTTEPATTTKPTAKPKDLYSSFQERRGAINNPPAEVEVSTTTKPTTGSTAIDTQIKQIEKEGFFSRYMSFSKDLTQKIDRNIGKSIKFLGKVAEDTTKIGTMLDEEIERGLPTKQDLVETTKGLGKSSINTAIGFSDFMTKQAPKAVAKVLSATLEMPGEKGILFESEGMKNKREKAGKFFGEVANNLDGELQKRQQELGITGDTSIFEPSKFFYTLGSGAGSMALGVGASVLTKSKWAGGAALGLIEGSDTYTEAKQSVMEKNPGMSEDDAEQKAFALMLTDSAGIAYLEKVGLDFLFRTYAGGALYNRAVNAITETAQEEAQTLWSGLVGKYGYDKKQDLLKEMIEVAVTTPFLGMLGGSAVQQQSQHNALNTTIDRIKSSEAFNVEETIKQNPEMAERIYQDMESKTLTKEFAQGRVDDVAQKADMYQHGLGDEVRDSIDISDTTMEEIIEAGLEAVETAEPKSLEFDMDVQLVDEVEEKMKMSREDAEALVQSAKPLLDQYIDTDVATGKALVEDQQKEDALAEDIMEAIDRTDKETVKEALVERFESTEEEADEMIADALERFMAPVAGMEEDTIMKDIQEAAKAVEERGQAPVVEEVEQDVIERVKQEAQDFVIEEDSVSDEPTFTLEAIKNVNPALLKKAEKAKTVDEFIDAVVKADKTTRENVSIENLTQFFERVKNLTAEANQNTSVDDESTARGLAKKLIRYYVERGDTIKQLKDGQGGSSSMEYSASIGGYINGKRISTDKIIVTRVAGKDVEEIFSLKEIFDEITAEKTAESAFELFENDGWGVIFTDYNGRPVANMVYSFLDKKQKKEYDVIRDRVLNGTKTDAENKLAELQAFEKANKEAFEKARKAIDKITEEEDNIDNEQDNDIRGDIRGGSDSEGSGAVPKRSTKSRGSSTKPSADMARGERGGSDSSAGERSEQIIDENYIPGVTDNEERQKSTVYDNEAIAQIVNSKVSINKETGEITLIDEVSAEERSIVAMYKTAGGREVQGAEGRGLLDEYYTPEPMIEMTGKVLGSLGISMENAKVLEPSGGIGMFLAAVSDSKDKVLYEINETTASIAKILSPETTVINRPFEDMFITPRGEKKTEFWNQYDLVIGNPPYGEHRGTYKGLGEEKNIAKYEDYFIKRSLDITKEGGYVAMVVPSGFLRRDSSKAKDAIAELGSLEVAYRFPNGAFDNTDIGTDLLVFKKNTAKEDIVEATRKQTLRDDMYFRSVLNANNVLGESTTKKGKFGEEPYVKGTLEEAMVKFNQMYLNKYTDEIVDTDQAVLIEEAIENEVYKPEVYDETHEEAHAEMVAEEKALIIPANKKFYHGTKEDFEEFSLDRAGENTEWDNAKWGIFFTDDKKLATEFIETSRMAGDSRKGVVKEVYLDIKNPIDFTLEGILTRKNQAADIYELFTGERVSAEEALESLDEVTDMGEIRDFFEELYSDVNKKKLLQKKGYDGIVSSFGRDANGETILEYVAFEPKQIKIAKDKNTKVVTETTKKIEGNRTLLDLNTLAVEDTENDGTWEYVTPTGELSPAIPTRENAYYMNGSYYNRFNYAQGNIYEKIDALEKDKSKIDEEQYKKQKAVLEAVLPQIITLDRINLSPNARFNEDLVFGGTEENPTTLKTLFLSWARQLPMGAFGESSYWDVQAYTNNTPVRGGDVQQNEKDRRTRRIEGDRLFNLFLAEELDSEKQDLVVSQYNRKFNNYVQPDYRQVPLVGKIFSDFKGRELQIRDVQLQGVGFLVNKGVGLLAHDVGVGKTLQAILATNEMITRGWAKKPLIVLPSVNVYLQWVAEMKEIIPDIKINLLENLGGDFKGDLATLQIEEGTVSVVTKEGFQKLGFKDETYTDLTKDFLDTVKEPTDMTKRKAEKEYAKAKEQIGKGIAGTSDQRFFEDLGFDLLVVDEVHNANHIIPNAKMEAGQTSEFRAFQVQPSQFGLKTWLASQYILKQNQNRNVFLLSATPFTNNPLEYYSILSLMAQKELRESGIRNVNDFMTMFMEITSELEFKANGSYKEKSEVRGFKNYQQFQKLLTQFIDFRDGKEAGVIRPDRVSREYRVAETQDTIAFKEAAQELFKDTKNGGTLKAIGELRAIAFSPYLSKSYVGAVPSAKEFIDGSPKLKLLTKLIKQSLKDNPNAGQLVYSPLGVEYFPLIKKYLVKNVGLKESEVEILSGETDKKKRPIIQENFNKGLVKVVLGSDAIKEGVNLQMKTSDLYVLSMPWNFTTLRQVIGRAWRHGNMWKNVRINNIFTENSIDIFLAQKLQNKEKRYEEGLKFQGDNLDVGDVNFEELKFDLITDPVVLAELKFDLRQQELRNELSRIKADLAYQLRRDKEMANSSERLLQAKIRLADSIARGDDDVSWEENRVKEAQQTFDSTKETLRQKGIDVDSISAQITESENESSKIEAQLNEINSAKEAAMKEALLERQNKLQVLSETDYDKYIAERKEHNKTFYEQRETVKEKRTLSGMVKKFEALFTEEEVKTVEEIEDKTDITQDQLALMQGVVSKYLNFRDKTEEQKQRVRERRLDKFEREATGEFNLSKEDANEIFEEMFGKTDVKLLFGEDGKFLRVTKTGKTEGYYQYKSEMADAVLKVITSRGKVQSDTLFHEFLHGLLDTDNGFVTETERDGILNRVSRSPLLIPARLLMAASYSTLDGALINEEVLANDFAKWLEGKKHIKENVPFYEKILNFMRDFLRKITGLNELYEELMTKTASPRNEMEKFDFETKEKFIREDWKNFLMKWNEKIDVPDDLSFNRIKKDLNYVEVVTAQARDIYLKDPNEFSTAKMYEQIADERRDKKQILDVKFAELLNPYYELYKNKKLGSTDKVHRVLFEGDDTRKEYTTEELRSLNLNASEISAYKAVRQSFNIGHELLIIEMKRLGVSQTEIDEFRATMAGYMPHKWQYRYAVKTQEATDEDVWETTEMSTYKSKKEAEIAWNRMRADNPEIATKRFILDTLDNLEVDFFTEQGLSFEAMKTVITQAKTGDEVRQQMLEALRNMVKEKGFGRQYIKRTGVQGYDTKEVPQTIANYFAGMNGYITKMEAGKKYYNVLSMIDARRQKKYYEWLRNSIAYDMGNTKEFQLIKQMAFIYFLANDLSFLITNATQNLIVGAGELSKYMTGTQKILNPEKYLLKAMIDYSAGNLDSNEAKTIAQLIERGELGGEMVSELVGIKNNPLYTEISSRFNKVMYGATTKVEQNVNRVPAFLAARRLFLEQGMDVKEANEKAIEVSNDIHFRYGKQHRPQFMRGRTGSALFVFQHYMRSLLYQLYRDASRKEFASLTRKLSYTAIIGGATSLPFYALIMSMIQKITGDDDDDEDRRELKGWDLFIQKGLPALTGVDLSGRVGIEILSIDSILDDPNDIRGYLGAIGSLIWVNPGAPDKSGRIAQGVELLRQGRGFDALGKLLPDMFANPIKAYTGYVWGVRSFAGTPLENVDGDVYKYNTWEAIIRATGFTPTMESLIWEEKSEEWANVDAETAKRTLVRRTIQGQVLRGEIDEARQTQKEAIASGDLPDDIDYIREFGKDMFYEQALDSAKEPNANLKAIEKTLISNLYEDPTDTQINAVRKNFAVFRTFGKDDVFVNDMLSAQSNKEKVEVLKRAKLELGDEAFAQMFQKGRKSITLESGNQSKILISDELEDEWQARKNEPMEEIKNVEKYKDNQKTSESNILDTITTYAEAVGTDPLIAFNRIFTGQKIRRVDSGAIIVERADLETTQGIREDLGATGEMRLDHTIPLQLGGSNSRKNLKLVSTDEWASYTPIENYLGKLLRDEKINKTQAQEYISDFKNGKITAEDIYNIQ